MKAKSKLRFDLVAYLGSLNLEEFESICNARQNTLEKITNQTS